MRLASVCNTDLELVRGYYPIVLKSTYTGRPRSTCGPFAAALDALGRGKVDPRPL